MKEGESFLSRKPFSRSRGERRSARSTQTTLIIPPFLKLETALADDNTNWAFLTSLGPIQDGSLHFYLAILEDVAEVPPEEVRAAKLCELYVRIHKTCDVFSPGPSKSAQNWWWPS